MFTQSLLTNEAAGRRGWTFVTSFSGQVLTVMAALLVPLVSPDALPRAALNLVTITVPRGAPPPPPQLPTAARPRTQVASQPASSLFMEPRRIPSRVLVLDAPEELPTSGTNVGVMGGQRDGERDGVVGSIFNDAQRVAPPPPAPAETKPQVAAVKKPAVVRLGGVVASAKLIQPAPQPAYPILAKQTRTQGTVVFAAMIGVDGAIRNLTLIEGHPLLVEAAREAVARWRYHPTLLNGDPVEVATTIEVRFKLN